MGYSPCGQEEWDVTALPSGGLITFWGHTLSFPPAVVAGGHPCLSTRLELCELRRSTLALPGSSPGAPGPAGVHSGPLVPWQAFASSIQKIRDSRAP